MPKEIKKCYNNLNLSYSSTVEQIEEREKILIKLLRAKAIKTGKSSKEKIQKIATDANTLIDYVTKFGIPNKKDFMFETSQTSILAQFLILASMLVVLYSAIYALI